MIDIDKLAPEVGSGGWDRRFLKLTLHIAQWSKDPSTKLGCVVVGPDREIRSTGFNGFPRGVHDTKERLSNRELKYKIICHAEENAIAHASRIGVSLKGCTAYCEWPPCPRCARLLINAGVKEVVCLDKEVPERWQAEFDLGKEIMAEGGIEFRAIALDVESSIEVAHCHDCDGITIEPLSEVCGCGSNLHPVSKSVARGTTLSPKVLKGA